MPAGPAPITSTSLSAFAAFVNFSGCQPRRNSSPEVAFCVQTSGGPPISQREMQTLQPMHSRMSSRRPSRIFAGRNGSAIDGRAAPMMSHWPLVMTSTIVSGLTKRPTLSTGLSVCCLTLSTNGRSWFSGCVRDGAASSPHSTALPTLMSHMSTRWSMCSMNCTPSPSWRMPRSPRPCGKSSVSTPKRIEIAQSSPIASRTSSSTSRVNRARFSNEPPYSSVRRLKNGRRN